jgi:hypothetical protein
MPKETKKKSLPPTLIVTMVRIVRAIGGGPIRTIVERGHNKPTGMFASLKCGRSMPWEDIDERHLMWLSEVESSVRKVLAQPFRLEILLKGWPGKMVYFPDIERRLEGGIVEIIEVKKTKEEIRRDPHYAVKIRLAAKIFKAMGWIFRVKTAEDDMTGWPMANARMIVLDRYTKLRSEDYDRLGCAFEQAGGRLTYAAGIRALSARADTEDADARAKLHAMIVRRFVRIDISRPIRPNSPITQIGGRP